MTAKKTAAVAATEPTFAKDALVNSKRFRHKRDLASAVLVDGCEYTIAEAEAKIEEYLKGKVK